uniref:Uncharacterized protein n=1 Tax=Melicertus latisulcatus majanivirus TaxID=2984277 RepID=A0A9C7CD80_9VIRU|nr:MAG: hypothetical protein [Melicertus latisulcatus majanivirus]
MEINSVIRNMYVSNQIDEIIELVKEILICTSKIIINTLNIIFDYYNKSQSPCLPNFQIQNNLIMGKIQNVFQTSLKIEHNEWQTIKNKLSSNIYPIRYEQNINIFDLDQIFSRLLKIITILMMFIDISDKILYFVSNIKTVY